MSSIVLRPRQVAFCDRSMDALVSHGNTLAVAMTSFGKSIVIGEMIRRLREKGHERVLVSQHRDELVGQNRKKCHLVNDNIQTSIFDGRNKDYSGDAVFGMVQSMTTSRGLEDLLPFDTLVIDEVQHAASKQYKDLINRCRELNPNLFLYGVTATPGRGDKKGLHEAGFTNVCDHVTAAELIKDGLLVPPRTFVVDLGVTDQLKQVKKTRSDFDERAVAAILDHEVLTQQVIRHWEDKAKDRKTIVFCSTVEHAQHVCDEFNKTGYKFGCVYGDMPKKERAKLLNDLRSGELHGLTNVYTLTEGYDDQSISCVILLRQDSHHSSYIQMIGRGLRIITEPEFQHIYKKDCIVLDFGVSTLIHGSIESEVSLYSHVGNGECVMKVCPVCESEVPASTRTCPFCGYDFPQRDKSQIKLDGNFALTEIDIINSSPFQWSWLYTDYSCRMACGFNAWAGIFFVKGEYAAIGCNEGGKPKLLFKGDAVEALNAADTFLINHEQTGDAAKIKQWLVRPPTQKQIDTLEKFGHKVECIKCAGEFGWLVDEKRYGKPDVYLIDGLDLSRYTANLYMTLDWNRKRIMEVL